jgi:hypothetical protein
VQAGVHSNTFLVLLAQDAVLRTYGTDKVETLHSNTKGAQPGNKPTAHVLSSNLRKGAVVTAVEQDPNTLHHPPDHGQTSYGRPLDPARRVAHTKAISSSSRSSVLPAAGQATVDAIASAVMPGFYNDGAAESAGSQQEQAALVKNQKKAAHIQAPGTVPVRKQHKQWA